ncbi:hypothetical protein [Alkalibacter mobilis]|uniref:hypothetical protein n=1 Tax=Alkalibacter mobilis TaxID=2787712 RepID=UPI0018A079A1|nr:hypothetical protein [Alkalibacter mobilis]MBF7096502.1 hypothetical protein [Alkalibacter mobilis]
MRITLQQVENLRKRVDCDYQTAEKILRKVKGDEDQAVLYVLKRRNHKAKKIVDLASELLQKLFSYNLLLIKNGKKIIEIPMVLLIAAVAIFHVPLEFMLILVVAAVIGGYAFELDTKESGIEEEMTGKMDQSSHRHQDIDDLIEEESDKLGEKNNNFENVLTENVDENDDYDEIIIE